MRIGDNYTLHSRVFFPFFEGKSIFPKHAFERLILSRKSHRRKHLKFFSTFFKKRVDKSKRMLYNVYRSAGVAELADAHVWGACDSIVRVRFPSPAPTKRARPCVEPFLLVRERKSPLAQIAYPEFMLKPATSLCSHRYKGANRVRIFRSHKEVELTSLATINFNVFRRRDPCKVLLYCGSLHQNP